MNNSVKKQEFKFSNLINLDSNIITSCALIIVVLILMAICLGGCKKEFLNIDKYPKVFPTITSFEFKKSDNPTLDSTRTGIFKSDSIFFKFNIGTNISNLLPTITYSADSISPSDLLRLDFDTIKQYTVINKGTSPGFDNVLKYKIFINFDTPNTQVAPAINITQKYATANDGSDLKINIQSPSMPLGSIRPLIVFTHGTGNLEQNALAISAYTSSLVAQGFVVANFNFFGSDNTKNNNDGKHLYNQYPMVVDYLINNASTYHINTNAIILCGASGSAAMAVHTAIKKGLFGSILECGGMVTGYTWDMPTSIPKTFSFAGIQTRSDNGFGGYFYYFSDAESGASHNGNAYTENMGLRHYTGMLYDGDHQYCTAWGDAGLVATKNYLSTKYGVNLKSESSYIYVIENSKAHCPGGVDWTNFMTTTPKKILNDRGITW